MTAPISSLRGAVIAIAGAGSGIGRGAAVHLASLGAHLSLADVSFEAVERHAAEIRASGGQCLASRCDVRDAAAVKNWIDSTVQAFGNLDGAVNCAGVSNHLAFPHSCPQINFSPSPTLFADSLYWRDAVSAL